MKPEKNNDRILEIMSDAEKVRQIIQSGIKAALLKHKQAGNPVCSWKNGKVYWIEAKNIPVNDK